MMDSDEYSINKMLVCLRGFICLVIGKNKMKDFLTIYNKMAERCFNHCIDNFNCRELTSAEENVSNQIQTFLKLCGYVGFMEEKCIENCSSKGLGANQKLMLTYIEVQPQIVNKRAEEIQQQQSIAEANNNSTSSS